MRSTSSEATSPGVTFTTATDFGGALPLAVTAGGSLAVDAALALPPP